MSSSQYLINNIVKLGLSLLKTGFCTVPDEYQHVFKLLNIDVSNPLQLTSLQSIFSGHSDSPSKYFATIPLCADNINYPIHDKSQSVTFSTINGDSLTVLEKNGSFVAVTGYETISVYDLFKTAAALYNCLEKSNNQNPFLLVTADFSGIQDTVYTISSKGALKTLRARSFMLELLTEHIVYELLQASKSDRTAIIYSGGGGFSLLLPNTADNINAIIGYRDILNRWAFTEFSGKLFIALDALECNEDKLKSKKAFKELRQTQADNLDKLKRRKFINEFSFTNAKGKIEGLFLAQMPAQVTVQTECQITRRDDLLANEMRDLDKGTCMNCVPIEERNDDKWTWVSESCYHQYHLGDKLIGVTTIYRSKTTQKNQLYFKFKDRSNNDVYYSVENNGNIESTWQINSWNNDCPTILYADFVRTIGQLPKAVQDVEEKSAQKENRSFNNKNTATFEGLAASSCGANLIGALRMDVDNMGNLFSEIGSLTELSTKSRMLNMFFKVYLKRICHGNLDGGLVATDIVGKKYAEKNDHGDIDRNVSVVYAGGDDLFILGAWDETTELSFDIQRCFHQFTGGDYELKKNEKRVTISGGLTLHHPKFPLYQMAKKSGEAEHVAKHDRDADSDDIKKNRIALFHDDAKAQRKLKMQHRERYMLSMTWDLGNTFLLPLMETYHKCGRLKEQEGRYILEIEKFSYQIIEKWFSVIEKNQESHKLYLPTMARVMKQVEENPKMDAALFKTLLSYLYTNDESKKNWISHLHIALNWLSYLRRIK